MADEQGAEPQDVPADADTQTNDSADELVPKSKFEDVKQSRDKMKARLRELEAKEAEREKAEQEAKRRKMEEAQQYEELKAELQRERDEALAALTKEREQLRFRDYATQVAQAAGAPPAEVDLVLSGLLAKGAIELPEEVDKRSVDAGAKKLREVAPSLFKPKTQGGSPLGNGIAPEKNTAEWAESVGRSLSKGRKHQQQ